MVEPEPEVVRETLKALGRMKTKNVGVEVEASYTSHTSDNLES